MDLYYTTIYEPFQLYFKILEHTKSTIKIKEYVNMIYPSQPLSGYELYENSGIWKKGIKNYTFIGDAEDRWSEKVFQISIPEKEELY